MSDTDTNDFNPFGDEVEPIIPDGWENDPDFVFGEPDESATAEVSPAPASDVSERPAEEAAAPTTEQTEESAETGGGKSAAGKLRFSAKFDGKQFDAELDESDLPTVYQKSLVTDRVQKKLTEMTPVMSKAEQLARRMGYESVDAMLDSAEATYRQNEIDKLVEEGVHKSVAEDMIERRFQSALKSGQQSEETQSEPEVTPADKGRERDLAAETADLVKLFPQLQGKEVPKEVLGRAEQTGLPLTVAYLQYENEQSRAEIARLTKVNQVHEQNAASAARAPVGGVTGGGATDTAPSDPFLDGFNSYFD